MRRVVAVVSTLALSIGVLAWPAGGSAAAQPSGSLRLEVRVDGQLVGDRLVVDPSQPSEVTVTVSNGLSSPVEVKAIRLSGSALGLTFFAYDTTLAFDVPPEHEATRTFPLELTGLQRQATGLLPATVQLLGPDRAVLAEVQTTSEVRGSIWSVYGVLWMVVGIMTLLAWASVLMALFRRRLPVNRMRRAARFLPAGIGTGLAVLLTLSVTGMVAPTAMAVIPLVLACTAAAVLLGYLAPYPNDDLIDYFAPIREAAEGEPSEDPEFSDLARLRSDELVGAYADDDPLRDDLLHDDLLRDGLSHEDSARGPDHDDLTGPGHADREYSDLDYDDGDYSRRGDYGGQPVQPLRPVSPVAPVASVPPVPPATDNETSGRHSRLTDDLLSFKDRNP